MVSELASWSSESSPELLPESLPEEMMSTNTTLLPGSSLEESALTLMRADRFFLSVEGKNHASPWRVSLESVLTSMRVDRFFLLVEQQNPASPWRASLESANLALARVYGFLPRATKNRPFPWSAEEDTLGRRARTTPLHHRGTSLSWRGRRTTPRKTDGDVAEGPPPCRNSP
jgi:hypothetical protein